LTGIQGVAVKKIAKQAIIQKQEVILISTQMKNLTQILKLKTITKPLLHPCFKVKIIKMKVTL